MSVKIIRPRANTDQYCLSYRFAVHNICYYYQGNKTCQLSVNKVARQQNMSKLPPTKVMMSQYFHLLFGDWIRIGSYLVTSLLLFLITRNIRKLLLHIIIFHYSSGRNFTVKSCIFLGSTNTWVHFQSIPTVTDSVVQFPLSKISPFTNNLLERSTEI